MIPGLIDIGAKRRVLPPGRYSCALEEVREGLVDTSSALISVVIPAYQAEDTIERAVKSALAIPSGLIEVIVVDDGSSDGTFDLASAIARTDDRLAVIRQDNCGRCAARNAGVAAATGKWLFFMDSDDYLLADSLSTLLVRARLSESPLVIFGVKRSDGLDQFGQCSKWGGDAGVADLSVFIPADEFAEAMIENERKEFVDGRWRYESNSCWSRLYMRELMQAVANRTASFKPFPVGLKFSEDRLLNIAYLKGLGGALVEFVPVPLYYWDLGKSSTCAQVRSDDAKSLRRYLTGVRELREVGLLDSREADKLFSREFYEQFRRSVTASPADSSLSCKFFRDLLSEYEVLSAMSSIPVDCLGGSPVWRLASRLIARGHIDFAYSLCGLLGRARAVVRAL